MGITGLQVAAKVTIDTAEAEGGLKRVSDAAGSAGGGIKGFLSNVASIAGAIGVTQLAGSAFGFVKDQLFDSVHVAEDYQQAQAQLAQGLKSTNDASGETVKGLTDLSEAYSKTTTFSKATIEQSEAVSLTFTNIGKNVFPAATMAAMNLATRMGTDLPSATLQVDKALGDPIKGITALTRVGVVFTQQQKDQIKAMQDSGNMAGAQGIILGELQKEFGGSATAAGSTFAGALQIAQNQLEDTKEKIGTALLPVLAQLLKFLTPIIAALSDGLANALPIVTGLFSQVMAAVQPFIAFLPNMFLQLQNIGEVFMNGLKPGIDAVTSAFSGFKGPGGSAQGLIQQISIALGRVGPLFYQVGQAISQGVQIAIPILQQLWQIFTKNLLPVISQLWQIILTDVFPILKQLAIIFQTDVLPAVSSIAQWVNEHLLPAIQQFADFVKNNVMPVVSNLGNIFKTEIIPTVENIATAFTEKLLPPIEHLASVILPILNVILTVAGWLFANVVGPAISLVIGLVGGLIDTVAGVISAFGGIAGAIAGAFGGLWGIVKAPINSMIDGINVIIGGLDSIHFSLPDWVPGVGGKGFGIDIGKIPHLAAGTDDFEGGPAIIGEGGTPELVTGPTLAKLASGSQVIPVTQEAAATLAGGLSPAYGAASASQGGQGVPIIIQIDGRTIAQIVLANAPTVLRNATGQRAM